MARFGIVLSLVLTTLVLLAVPTTALGQSYAFGIPPFSSVDGGPDSINLSNLGVVYNVPIFSRAGRGSTLSLNAAIQNFTWSWVFDGSGDKQWVLTLAPPSIGNPVGSVVESAANETCIDPRGRSWPYTLYTFYAYYDANGASHQFSNLQIVNIVWNVGGTCPTNYATTASAGSSDGSGVSITVSSLPAPAAVVTLRDGTVINPPLTTLKGWGGYAYWTSTPGTFTSTDSNGNKVTASESDGYLNSVTDTLGSIAVTGPGDASSISYTPPSGTSATYSFSTTRLNVETDFSCPGIDEFSATPFDMLTTITLPDLSYYQITYEQTSSGNITGRIGSVRLPTGAIITYTYTGGDTGKGIVCSDGSVAGFNRATPDGTWKYLRSNFVYSSGGIVMASTTTVTDPQGNNTVVNFGGNFETQRQVYTGAATGTPLETIVTCYNGNTSNCATAQSVVPGGEINVFRSLNGGPNSEVDTFYSSGLVTAKNEYDFGATTPTRKTTITYDSTIGNGVIDRPHQVTVTDGSGNIKSQTTYTYDEDEVAGTLKKSGASQLSAVTCTASSGKCRGNATTVVSWLNSGAILTKKFVHYDTGQAYTATDVNGAVTQYTYGNCGNSLLTNVSLPLSLSQSSSWNCTGGMMTSSTDTNGKTSYTNYTTDPYFWRPESTKDQLGNITNLTYPSLIRSESSLELNSTSYVDVVTSLDTLGRSSLSQTRQGVGSSYFDTAFQTYDSAGRPYKTFMPCQAAEGTGCSTPSTTTTYDGMGRPLTVTDGGGGTSTYTYTKNDVLIKVSPAPTGENVKQRQLEYDGMGRLTSVCEITSASGSGSGPCNQKNPKTGLLTTYTYDALDNLLTVTQNTQTGAVGGSQARTYTYDGLSRLTSETNPESSNLATTYTYDYDPGGDSCATGSRTSPGDMLKKVDPNGHYTCYIYDKLHRVTDVGNSLQGYSYTPCRRFRYDSPSNGVQPQPPSSTITNVGGRLVEVETDSGSMITDEWFSYDNDGRQTDVYEKTPNSGGYYHTTASYWAHNQQETLGIMNSAGVALIPLQTYGVDGEGRINSVKPASGYIPVSSVTYATSGTSEPIGSLTQITFGSGDSDSYQYDTNTGRMTQYSFNVNGQSAVGKLTWNANGTLQKLAITDPFNSQDNQTCTNAYDDLSRLSSNSCGSLWAQTFTYDAFGNLTKNGTSAWVPGYNGSTNHYTLAGTTYDGNGNLLTDTFNTYTWNAYGDLASVNGITLTYDALDRMVENANNGGSQLVYAPNGQHPLANMVGQQLASAIVPLPAGAFAVYWNPGQLVQYNHADWLGSARLFSTPSRTATPAMAYAPFGEGYAGGQAYVQFTSYGNAWTVADGEGSGGTLDDFTYRRYSPGQGRWISPDPAGLGSVNPSNPQSWNRYSYVLNNPLINTDPDGLDCVYLNDAGDDVESIDHDSDAGECTRNDNGGYWVPGDVKNSSWVTSIDQNNGAIGAYSSQNGFLSFTASTNNSYGVDYTSVGVDVPNTSVPLTDDQAATVAIANAFNNNFPTACTYSLSGRASVLGLGFGVNSTQNGTSLSFGVTSTLSNSLRITIGMSTKGLGAPDPGSSIRIGPPIGGLALNPTSGQVGAYVGKSFSLFGKETGATLTATVGKIGTNNSCGKAR